MQNKDTFVSCQLCEKTIALKPQISNSCDFCGWRQHLNYNENPDSVIFPNRVSFNRAIELVKQGKPLIPTLDDFAQMVKYNLHAEFFYKSRHYGVLDGHGNDIEFYEMSIEEGYQSYPTIDEFKEKAHIGGKLLKDIWHEVVDADYM